MQLIQEIQPVNCLYFQNQNRLYQEYLERIVKRKYRQIDFMIKFYLVNDIMKF
jgi:disulfide oxidoreductase YuzD